MGPLGQSEPIPRYSYAYFDGKSSVANQNHLHLFSTSRSIRSIVDFSLAIHNITIAVMTSDIQETPFVKQLAANGMLWFAVYISCHETLLWWLCDFLLLKHEKKTKENQKEQVSVYEQAASLCACQNN